MSDQSTNPVFPKPPSPDAALMQIDEYLRYLSGGVSFCGDRGFGWDLQSEGWRRESIAALFARVPELTPLLPEMAARLRAGETIADHDPTWNELRNAVARRNTCP